MSKPHGNTADFLQDLISTSSLSAESRELLLDALQSDESRSSLESDERFEAFRDAGTIKLVDQYFADGFQHDDNSPDGWKPADTMAYHGRLDLLEHCFETHEQPRYVSMLAKAAQGLQFEVCKYLLTTQQFDPTASYADRTPLEWLSEFAQDASSTQIRAFSDLFFQHGAEIPNSLLEKLGPKPLEQCAAHCILVEHNVDTASTLYSFCIESIKAAELEPKDILALITKEDPKHLQKKL